MKSERKPVRRVLSAVLALVMVCTCMVTGVYAKGTTKKYYSKYPVVLIHGFMGWGENDGIDSSRPYWGYDLIKHLQSEGYEVYHPSLGPYAGAWDRACEIWAYLYGGTVDYGKVHSEKCHHKRYGRTYKKGVLEDLGKTKAHKKIELLGHSFGGPTVKQFVELLSNGSAEERNGTSANDLSPLFKGGHGDIIHTVTTLDGVNNGTTLADLIAPYFPAVVRAILVANMFVEDTPIEKMMDLGNQQFGVGKYPEEIKGITLNPPFDTVNGIEAYANDRQDNIAEEMRIDFCQEENAKQGVNPHIYYFAQRSLATHQGSDGKPVPEDYMGTTCRIPATLMCAKLPDNVTTVKMDDSWWPNDGYVNVIGQSAPLNQPSVEATWKTAFKPGLWYNMPLVKADHVFWMGMSGTQEYLYQIFDQMLDTYRQLPDA